MRGLKDCDEDDLIILSDVDEIPDLTKLNLFDKKNRYAVFAQKKFDYKLNLLNETEGEWHGSKICLKKNLKSPQWLRTLKFKKYPFWRIDKIKDLQIIQKKNIFNLDYVYKKVEIDSTFPKYILENKEKLKDWII